MGTYRIALANLEIPASREESLHHALQAIELAGREHADIICFPECFVPGYREASRLMPPPDAAFLERAWTNVAETAAQNGIAVILGTERIVDSGLRATALVVNRDGTIAGFQDKVQIAIEEENIYTPGTERHLFRSGPLTFGIVICHDEGWRYPETVRWAARRGAQVVFHPHFHQRNPTNLECPASDDPARKVFENAMVCRAAENACYFASVNCASAGGTTTSTVIAPDGALLASHPEGKAGLIVIEVDLDASTGHCHVALEKSDVSLAFAVSGRNDSGAFGLSGSQAATVSRALSRHRGVILVECHAINIAVTDFRKRSFPNACGCTLISPLACEK